MEKPIKEEKDFYNSHTGTKMSHTKTTWHSPDGVAHNQVDYIVAPRRFMPSINRAKMTTFPRAYINSDYDLVMMTMKLILKQNLRSQGSRLKFNLEKVNVPEVAAMFEATI